MLTTTHDIQMHWVSVTFGSDRIRMYRGSDKKTSLAGSYRLPTPERVPEGTRSRAEETRDGQSRAGGSEHSEEPQTETRGELSNISSEVVAMSTHWGQGPKYPLGTW